MAEINNSLAAQVNSSPLDLTKTLGAISQIELAQAHAGLYGLQAQQEARKLQGFEYLKGNPTDYQGAIQRGLDPTVGASLQTMAEKERAYGMTPGNISPDSANALASANMHRAQTVNTLEDVNSKRLDNASRIGNMIMTGATVDDVAKQAQTLGVPIPPDQLSKFRQDPALFQQAGKNLMAAGMKSQDFTAPHNVNPTDAITSRAAMMQPPVASTNRVVGDREAVSGGMYEPTPAETAKGWVAAPPASRVAQTFGQVPPAMTPGQKAESDAYGTEMAKALPALAEKADNSRQMNFTLQQMKDESQSWDMGKGGQALMTASQYLKPIATALGSTAFDKPVADYESFQKNAGTLVRQAVKEVSPRAAVQEFQLIQAQLPSADMSRGGFNQIVNQFQAVNDYNIAKHQAGQIYRDATGSMDKFDAEWNKNVTPSAFLVSRLSPEQLTSLKTNLQKTPEGRSTLQSITKQLQWAHDHKLDEMVR